MRHKGLHKIVLFFLSIAFVFIFHETKAQNLASQNQNLESYYKKALDFKHQNNISGAIEVLENAIDFAEKNNNPKGLIDIYQKIAFLHIELNSHDTASFYRETADRLLKKIEYRLSLIHI